MKKVCHKTQFTDKWKNILPGKYVFGFLELEVTQNLFMKFIIKINEQNTALVTNVSTN